MSHMITASDSMFSVRKTPWHRLGVVLEEYPKSIEEAIEKAGLGWKVRQGSVLVADGEGDPATALRVAKHMATLYEQGTMPNAADLEQLLAAFGSGNPALTLAQDYRANRREDDGAILGIVSGDYKVVQNEEAFKFLDALIGSELHFETAGSLMNGKRVWVLARLPEFTEVAGDPNAMFVYVANSHDGSQAVTASATNVRIVCHNTLSWALRQSEFGPGAERTYKFRHTGDLALKFDEARKVMGMTVNYAKRFKALGDRLALEPMTTSQFSAKVADKLITIDPDTMGKVAIRNRVQAREQLVNIFNGAGPDGDTRGNSPYTKWCAANTVAEYSDWCRRVTIRTDQMSRSFEDNGLKQRGLEFVLAA